MVKKSLLAGVRPGYFKRLVAVLRLGSTESNTTYCMVKVKAVNPRPSDLNHCQ